MRHSGKDIAMNIGLIKQSGFFDERWYVSAYPDVPMVNMDPADHYLRIGEKLLRSPGPYFDTRKYLFDNPSIAAAGASPLLHYLNELAKRHTCQPGQASLATKEPQGYVDVLDETRLSSWAIDPAAPNACVALTLFIDGQPLMDLRTDERRHDLIAKGMDGTSAGFQVPQVRGLFRKGSVVDVRFASNGKSLSGSPRTIAGNDVLPSGLNPELYLHALNEGAIRSTTVVVPVFNAYEAVEECLASLASHCQSHTRVLVLDDCSTDERIAPLLRRYRDERAFKIERNPSNLGYTQTINKAIQLCPEDDVVLLNSDTVVTAGWFTSLRYCAYACLNVATVTAVSDNAGAFSVPDIEVSNQVPPYLSREQFARAVQHAGSGRALSVPTGNGFCMFIKREALEKLGLFDEQKFPRGYGEENDFCMRAFRAGMLNLVCDKSFVFHKRSQSFHGEKQSLMEQGARQLAADYPEYGTLTPRFRDIEFSLVRHQIRKSIEIGARAAMPRIMFVISTQTGGTPQTNLDLMRAVSGQYDCFLLRCDSRRVILSRLIDGELVVSESLLLARPISPINHQSAEYDSIILGMLYRYSVSLLHIRHMAWHGLGLARAAKALEIPIVFSVHDFYSICPTVNLIDSDQRYCAGNCSSGESACYPALWPRGALPELRNRFIHRWREMFSHFLGDCDRFVTTSPSAADLFSTIYPETFGRLRVIPHGRDFLPFDRLDVCLPDEGPVRVLVPGNIGITKGAALLRDIEALDVDGEFEFHFLGMVSEELALCGVQHGPYDRANFFEQAAHIKPSLGVVLSNWPETYCHTLSEMWACGIPVLGIDRGAVGERIRASGAGWLVPPDTSAALILDMLRWITRDRSDFARVIGKVDRWRNSEAIWNDTATMAGEYKELYRKLLTQHCEKPTVRVGFVVKGGLSFHPPTTHIRVLTPLTTEHARQKLDARPVSAEWLLAGGIEKIDVVLVQRDAMPVESAGRLLSMLSERRIPYVYEIDDLLWELPADHKDHSISPTDVGTMLRFISAADVVTTSTTYLTDRLATMAKRVELIPNALDERLWLTPLPTEYVTRVGDLAGMASRCPRILYMGTRSHAADLEMIEEAIWAVQCEVPELEVVQINGGRLLKGARQLAVPPEASDYPGFVRWFRAISTYADIGIAPLRETEFNRAKSDIKTLDYGLARLPAVYSDWGPYRESIEHRVNGWLASSDAKSWVYGLLTLLSDEGLRQSIRHAAFERALGRRARFASIRWIELLTSLKQSASPADNVATESLRSVVSAMVPDPAGDRSPGDQGDLVPLAGYAPGRDYGATISFPD